MRAESSPPQGPPGGGPRVQPFYCPYCGEEDFVPSGALGASDGEFHCRSCDRRFRVAYLGPGPGALLESQPAGPWASDTP